MTGMGCCCYTDQQNIVGACVSVVWSPSAKARVIRQFLVEYQERLPIEGEACFLFQSGLHRVPMDRGLSFLLLEYFL